MSRFEGRGRRVLLGALGAAAVLAASCGGDDGTSTGGAGDGEGSAGGGGGAAAAAEPGAFPVTIEHRFGETVIEEPPERVVTVGFTDHDPVLALDVRPVGVREWYGDQPHATFPWAQDELGDAEPEIVGDGSAINYEAVAELDPDLIIGIYADLSESYDTLSQIAPTVAQSGDYEQFGQPWQETTRQVGRALGQPERADELVTGVEDRFAEARAEHPEFQGTTAAMAQFGEGSGTYFLLHPEDPKAAFLVELGFEIPGEISDVIEDEQSEELSFERLDFVDQDIAVWLAGFESPDLIDELQSNQVYQNLDVAREGRDLFLEEGVDALSWATVLSLDAALDDVVPQLAEVAEGGGSSADG